MRQILRTLFLTCLLTACATPQPTTSIIGSWVVMAAEHEGRSMDSVIGGTLILRGEEFQIRTAAGSELHGRFHVNATKFPHELDLNHVGGMTEGTHWLAIYEISGDTLRLNYVDAKGKDSRPSQFTTSADTEASLMILRRTGQ